MTASLPATWSKESKKRTVQPVTGTAIYRSTKTYDHSEGLSCCFRQWRAESHCRLMHGYALAFRFVFATRTLDHRNWCMDFGGLKAVRNWLHEMFDHTTLVAADDPHREEFERLNKLGLVDLRVLPSVGCEAVAQYAFEHVGRIVQADTKGRVWVESVEVREHSGNSAMYQEEIQESEPAH
jgi:6-pyruvoyltetrahydropterin/6-carboxytetrahydropterin synthase